RRGSGRIGRRDQAKVRRKKYKGQGHRPVLCHFASPGAASWSAGLRGRRLREVVEDLALHALDFGAISARNKAQFFGTTADSQPCKQVEEVRDPLSCDLQFLVVLNHGRISTVPRRRPSRFVCQKARNCSRGSPSSISGRTQKM